MLRFCLALVVGTAAWAQAQAEGDQPTFEIASVKPAKLGGNGSMGGGPGTKDPGRFTAMGVSLGRLLYRAYNLDGEDRLSIPARLDSGRFEVAANVPPGTTVEQFRQMLQNLLAERFQMKMHHETKVVPVYELTVAKNGPKLKPAAPGDGTDSFAPGRDPVRLDPDNFPILPPGRENQICRFDRNGAHCTYRLASMETLVRMLSGPGLGGAGRRVVEKTGLTDQYDFTLYFRPLDMPNVDAPEIDRALQEQLGLRLVPSKASIDVLVIDHAEMPTEN